MATKKKMLQAAAGVGGDIGAWDLAYAYYDDPFAWDISTAIHIQTFPVSSQETNPKGLFFKPDGTKMYVAGASSDNVNEYSLSTAWDVSTASYVQNFSLSAQDTNTFGLFFKPDGTKMYTVGGTGIDVNEYSLSTAWDVSTASYTQNFSVVSEETNPTGIFFKPDGTKMYVAGLASDAINEYSLSTAWDISTASYTQNFNVLAQEANTYGLFFKPDGTKMYIVGFSGDDVNEYSLSTAWDISTASYVQIFSVAAQETSPSGLFFKPDGTTMYMIGTVGDDVNQYSIGGFNVSAEETSPTDVSFKTDGTKMYVIGRSGDEINEYNLSSAWDTSTAVYSQTFSVSGQETNPFGLFFRPDGLNFYLCGTAGDDVNEYSLSTAWDISTASYIQSFSVFAQDGVATALYFKPDGTKMYVLGSANDAVYAYNLSTAWDVSSASYSSSFSVTTQEIGPQGLFFKPDGTKMYVAGNSGDEVNEYSLSTAWDISTASFSQLFDVSANIGNPQGVYISADGTKMFIVNYNNDSVHTYTLGVQE